jgi:hypothetical protein
MSWAQIGHTHSDLDVGENGSIWCPRVACGATWRDCGAVYSLQRRAKRREGPCWPLVRVAFFVAGFPSPFGAVANDKPDSAGTLVGVGVILRASLLAKCISPK